MPELDTVVLQRLNAQDDVLREYRDTLEEIRRNTNGRLRAVEVWQARADGARAAFNWLPMVIAAVLGSGVGGLIVVLSGHG